ncbi:hypothetical protein [Streptomyces canus]|nr:hypothetical protein [Streptomyces canus]
MSVADPVAQQSSPIAYDQRSPSETSETMCTEAVLLAEATAWTGAGVTP